MGWAGDGPCLPHDHGEAWGWALVLSGEVSLRIWSMENGSWCPEPWAAAQKGNWVYMEPGIVHQMRGQEGAVTLHFYLPVIDGMRVYDPEQKRAWRVKSECGAWLPVPSEIIREIEWAEE